MIPDAHVHHGGGARWRAELRAAWRWRPVSDAGRVAAWSLSLAVVQAAILLLAAADRVEHPRAILFYLVPALAVAAALVVGLAWVARMILPRAGRVTAFVVPLVYYGVAVLAASAARELLTGALLVPALSWAWWLPTGTLALPHEPRARQPRAP
jgi:hypothetical protein